MMFALACRITAAENRRYWKFYLLGEKQTKHSVVMMTDLYPARIFMREDFPAPLGPMMAVSCPDRNLPEMHLRIVL